MPAERRAAACLIVAEDKLDELGLTPIGWLVGWAAAGCDPARMGIGPVPAVQKVLARTGLRFDQMDLIELNEAFACQALACVKGWGSSMDALEDKLNVNGSGISLGHRWARRACASRPRCCTRCSAARCATASKRCASAAVRASR